MEKRCILVVDPQNDFCEGGSLEVPGGDEIMSVVNKILPKFQLRIVTQDWHPTNHSSFTEQGGQWPVHCVAGSRGAEFHPNLNDELFTTIIRKAMNREKDTYSAFGNTGLKGLLKSLEIVEVYVCGLATDYCVKATAIDVMKSFKAFVIKDACRAVQAEAGRLALSEMNNAGVKIITSEEITY